MANPYGMNRQLFYFALLTVIAAVLLLPFVGAAASYFLFADGPVEEPLENPLLEMVSVYFITVFIALLMAIMALPLTVPLGLVAWFASHRFLAEKLEQKWRIRFAAALAGLTPSVGFAFVFAWQFGEEKWPSISLIVATTVLLAVLISAEIIYRPARRKNP